jgi:hypothetical protein
MGATLSMHSIGGTVSLNNAVFAKGGTYPAKPHTIHHGNEGFALDVHRDHRRSRCTGSFSRSRGVSRPEVGGNARSSKPAADPGCA